MTEAALPEAILEAELSAQYHQPKGVEQFGVEAIPDDLKTVRWYDLFFIVMNFMINPGNILIGGMAVVAGLSFWASVAAETVGCLVAFCAYIVMATIGIDYGLPGQVATRMTFGLRGSKWLPSLLRSIASTYWFAFQTVAGSLVIVDVIDHWFGGHHSLLLVSIIFGVAQVVVAVVGYDSLKLLSRIAFPLKVIILIYLFYLLSHHSDPAFHPSRVFHYAGKYGWQWAVFVVWFNGMLASWLTMITDAADFCRYSRTRADMWIGTMLAVLCGTLFGGGLGAYAAAAVQGASYNPFTIVSSIHDTHLTLLLILIVIIFDNWTINVLNLYTGGLSVNNIFEKIGRFWTTLAIGVLGVALSAFPSLVQRLRRLHHRPRQPLRPARRSPPRRLPLPPPRPHRRPGPLPAPRRLLVLERRQPHRRRLGPRRLRTLLLHPACLGPDRLHPPRHRCRISPNHETYAPPLRQPPPLPRSSMRPSR